MNEERQDEILTRLCRIDREISDLRSHYGSFDLFGMKKTSLSSEYVFLSRQLDKPEHELRWL